MMPDILQAMIILIRTSLAAVLVAAGAAKLADLPGFATTLMGLGVPTRPSLLIRVLTYAIPFLELGVGVVAVSGLWPTVLDGALLILMLSFSIVVIVALRRHLSVACRCFGALSASQFSGKGLARNVFLTILALGVFWSGNAYPLQFEGPPSVILLLVVGFLLFAVAAAQSARTIAILQERAR
jgi:uncharacterized membrane protein YphA (DoxX/SURF4 family)